MKKIISVLVLCMVWFVSHHYVASASQTANVTSPFFYSFNSVGILNESGFLSDSTSPYWWVNSGGEMIASTTGTGQTIQGSLPELSTWRTLYLIANPVDTDNGYHPQNIFRLLTRSQWQNTKEQAYFKVNTNNLSTSPNRDVSNGLLLFSRYYDSSNTYYAGLRVDGAVVIKKKINGTYYTLAYKKILPGTYNRNTNPNLIPQNTWVGLKVETSNNADGSVSLNLYTDIGQTGKWALQLSTLDNNIGGKALINQSYTGIRTDFMDVEFDNFRIEKI